MEVSVSAVIDELPLPLREEAPPNEVRVAVERIDAREEPSKEKQWIYDLHLSITDVHTNL